MIISVVKSRRIGISGRNKKLERVGKGFKARFPNDPRQHLKNEYVFVGLMALGICRSASIHLNTMLGAPPHGGEVSSTVVRVRCKEC